MIYDNGHETLEIVEGNAREGMRPEISRKIAYEPDRRWCRNSAFILGVRVDVMTCQAALRVVRSLVDAGDGLPTRKVFFTNVHSIHLARKHQELRQSINQAHLVLPDGAGLKIAGTMFGHRLLENLNGTDFIPKVLRVGNSNGWSVYLLGSQRSVVLISRNRLRMQYPGLRIIGFHHGNFSSEEERHIIDDINTKRPDVLLVGLGSPLQEMWIARNAPQLRVKVCFGVGGLFDFLSETRRRAPSWMRAAGLEWFYRFLEDPKTKWNRVFIEIPLFLAHLLVRRIIGKNVWSRHQTEAFVHES